MQRKSASEHHSKASWQDTATFLSAASSPKQLTWQETLHQEAAGSDYGEHQLQGATWASVTYFLALKHAGPQLGTRHSCARGRRAQAAVEQREGKPLPWPGRAWWGSSGEGERIWGETVTTDLGERDVTHLRDLFAILRVPHRRGLGGDAGQPPPASGECFFPPTLPPSPRLPLPGHQARNARPRRGRTEGRTDTRPGSAAPLLPPAQPSQGCPQHVSERAPALCRPLSPPLRLLASGADPRPLPQRAALQGSQSPAGFCPLRRISRPASLQSRRLNLRTRPRTSLAGAGAREGRGGARRARARVGGGGALEAGPGTRGSRGGAGSHRGGAAGGPRAGGARGCCRDRPRSVPGAAPRAGGTPRAARGLPGRGVPALFESWVWKRRPSPRLPEFAAGAAGALGRPGGGRPCCLLWATAPRPAVSPAPRVGRRGLWAGDESNHPLGAAVTV